jgi:hypothetical protein
LVFAVEVNAAKAMATIMNFFIGSLLNGVKEMWREFEEESSVKRNYPC